ncbi:NAD(P)H-binding protein [Streptomyces sp. NPDC006976]|uniref:NAD(P)H-binding protein n=1 Tax=Streptomyces sp. NPDC006976 TaxID=3154311 RepID=UPI00340EB1A6
MRIAVFGANGPTGRHLTDQALAAGHEVVAVTRRPGSLPARPGLTPAVADYRTAPSSADGVFTARSDLAASMLRELEERRHVRTAMGVITTAVKPNIAKLIWNEGVKKK